MHTSTSIYSNIQYAVCEGFGEKAEFEENRVMEKTDLKFQGEGG